MNSAIESLNVWGERFMQFAWPMLWQSSVLIAILFALDFTLRRKVRASVRYALWLVVLVKLLLPPSLALPTGIAWWVRPTPPPKPQPQQYIVTHFDYAQPPTTSEVSGAFVAEAFETPKSRLSPAGWFVTVSGVISVTLLVWMILRWRHVARVVRAASPAIQEWNDLLDDAQRRIGLRRIVRLRMTDLPMSPAVCGLFRPVILLPRPLAEQLPPSQLRAVLLHELAHLKRGDVWVNCAQALLQIAYWWHPPFWLANARIRRLREEAVDDAVMLALRDEAETYAPTLLEVAKLALNRPLASLGLVGIMESRSALRQRIERLTSFRPPRKAGLTVLSALGVVVFSALAVPMEKAPAPSAKPVLPDLPPANPISEKPADVETDAAAFVQRGKLLLESGKLSEAEAELKKALRLEPENQPAWSYLSFVKEVQYRKTEGKLLPPATADAGTNIIYPSKERLEIVNKLGRIRLAHVFYDSVRLEDVIRSLTEETRQGDPDGRGVNFILNTGPDQPRAGVIDPSTGLPPAKNFIDAPDLNWPLIKINPALDNLTLGDLLDIIVKVADRPIRYSIEDFGVVLTLNANSAEQEVLVTRTLVFDPEVFLPNLLQRMNLPDKSTDAEAIAALPKYLAAAGLDLPPPCSYFLKERGLAFFHAPQAKIEAIERLFTDLNNGRPQSEIPVPGRPPDRETILRKLDQIRIDSPAYYQTPLMEVVRDLSWETKHHDPERKGFGFRTKYSAKLGPFVDLDTVKVTVPAFSNGRLSDLLEAVVKGADKPIKYYIWAGVAFYSTADEPALPLGKTLQDALPPVNATPGSTQKQTESASLPPVEPSNGGEEVKLRVIVLYKRVAGDAAQKRKLAEDIMAKVKGGAAFSEMATVFSEDRQRREGGDWGWIQKHDRYGAPVLRKELADAAFSLKPGEVSDVIETPHLICLMLVEDKRPAHLEAPQLNKLNAPKQSEHFLEKSHENAIDDLVEKRIRSEFSDPAALVRMLQARGMTFERFRQQLKQEVESGRVATETNAAAFVQNGRRLLEMGKVNEAEAEFKKALVLEPENKPAFYYLSFVNEARYRKNEGKTEGKVWIEDQVLPPATADSRTNVIYTSEARLQIINQLRRIRLERVFYDNILLEDVIPSLNEEAKRHDPDGRGVVFILNTGPNQPTPTVVNPSTGLPPAKTFVDAPDLNWPRIHLNPALTDIALGDALDVIVKVADRPIRYSIEDFGVVFSAGKPAERLYKREFKLDRQAFDRWARYAAGIPPFKAGDKTHLEAEEAQAMHGSMRGLFLVNGVDLNAPKSVFYSHGAQALLVNASQSDLNTIQRVVETWTTTSPPALRAAVSPSSGSSNNPARENLDPKVQEIAPRPTQSGIDSLSEPNRRITSGLASPTATETNVAKLVESGKLLAEMGKLDEAEARLKEAVAIDTENQIAHYYLDQIKHARNSKSERPSGHKTGRQEIVQKLHRIRLDRVFFDNVPLDGVIRGLVEEAKKRDPEGTVVNFILNPNLDQSGPTALDPSTGLPVAKNYVAAPELQWPQIKVNPALTNITLGDVLDIIVKVADKPIRYSIEDFGVVFSAGKLKPSEPLFMRQFKLDVQSFDKWLQYAAGTERNPVNDGRFLLPRLDSREMDSPTLSPSVQSDLPQRPERGGIVSLQRTNNMERMHREVRGLFRASGMDLSPPKSIFYNDRAAILLVNATQSDLDAIERLVEKWNTTSPPTVPAGASEASGKTSNLPLGAPSVIAPQRGFAGFDDPGLSLPVPSLENRAGVDILTRPQLNSGAPDRVPLLGDLPWLGKLFRPKTNSSNHSANESSWLVELTNMIPALADAQWVGRQPGAEANTRTSAPVAASSFPRNFLDPWGVPYNTNVPRTETGRKNSALKEAQLQTTQRFKIEATHFCQSLEAATGIALGRMETNHSGAGGVRVYVRTSTSTEVTRAVEVFLKKQGVNMDLPGRSAFFHERTSELIVSAPKAELEVITEAIQVLKAAPPQVSIKVRFVEVQLATDGSGGLDLFFGRLTVSNTPSGRNSAVGAPAMAVQPKMFPGVSPQAGGRAATAQPNAPGQTATGASASQGYSTAPAGILTDPQYRVVLSALEQRYGVDLLNAPEVVTPSGRQAQIQIVDMKTVVTGVSAIVTDAQTNFVYKTDTLPFGSTLDVIPQVLSDNQTISMTVIPTVTEFLGYDDPKQITSRPSKEARPDGQLPLPRTRVRQITSSATVQDGQTLVLMNFPDQEVTKNADGSETQKPFKDNKRRQLIVFVTPTIIDAAGNPLHSPP